MIRERDLKMLILITGGSGSGKSAFAESCVCACAFKERFYLATMQPFDIESKNRISRHRRMREGKNFHTLEQYTGLENVFLPDTGNAAGIRDRIVLLECMSNLTANEMFSPEGYGHGHTAEELLHHILDGVRHIEAQCACMVIVTNEIFSDGIEYPAQTRAYQQLLGEINCALAKRADEVYEVVSSIPVLLEKSAAGTAAGTVPDHFMPAGNTE